ncbi:MAG: MOSC domain-containing protein [Novosphingobium sp.]|nr:MOSC domain-containing protein [Novosphingobium sp.]
METTVIAVLCGAVQPFREENEPSAIAKRPVAGNVRVRRLGLDGDAQADLAVHGGVDKALHYYPQDHYAWWRGEIGEHPLLDRPGAFGENIAATGLTENDVCVGDRFRLGTALVEVSQGRQPCWKLDHRFGGLKINAAMVRSRRCGWYYRVIEEGQVGAGEGLSLVERPFPAWSVARVFGLLIAGDHKRDAAGLAALGDVAALSASWKRRREALLPG